MSKTSRTIVRMPEQARKGEIIEITAIAQHDMETGFRHSEQGQRIPRDIIRTFICTYNGDEVFRADMHPGTGANPLVTFTTIATESGTLEFRWTGDGDYLAIATSRLSVS